MAVHADHCTGTLPIPALVPNPKTAVAITMPLLTTAGAQACSLETVGTITSDWLRCCLQLCHVNTQEACSIAAVRHNLSDQIPSRLGTISDAVQVPVTNT
eukprot:scaffold292184_cov18-Tisochrysis_lutea.AAC.1